MRDPVYDVGANFMRVFLAFQPDLEVTFMRRVLLFVLGGLMICFATSTIARAAGHNVADYPLRVHIFQFNSHSHYYRAGGFNGPSSLDMVDGEGRANLCQNGEPRGFDFSYSCGARLMVSPGYETYPARWKKPGQTLEILQPALGKPGAFESCEMKIGLKDAAYFKHNGLLDEEPAATFKAWMEKHQYDPEHGKIEPQPVPTPAKASVPAAVPAPSAEAPGPQ
ncbi:MAG: hypothetical protein WB679_18050 [Terracidiphilus sp.]